MPFWERTAEYIIGGPSTMTRRASSAPTHELRCCDRRIFGSSACRTAAVAEYARELRARSDGPRRVRRRPRARDRIAGPSVAGGVRPSAEEPRALAAIGGAARRGGPQLLQIPRAR